MPISCQSSPSIPAECVVFENHRECGPSLVIHIPSPTKHEISQVRKGKAKFCLAQSNGVLFVMSKFGDLEWFDAPYHVCLHAPHLWGVVEEYQKGLRFNLAILLVDSSTGNQCGARVLTWSPHFSERFEALIEFQKSRPISRIDYDLAIERTYSMYPNSKSMLRAALAQCNGGD